MKKIAISLILCISMLLSPCLPVLALDNTVLESNTHMMDTVVFIENGRTYAPARFIAESFGIHVDWDYAMESAILTRGLTQVYMQVGMDNLLVAIYSENDVEIQTIPIDSKIVLRDNRTLLPVRYWAEAFGLKVDWDETKQMVTVSEGNKMLSIIVGQKELQITGGNFQQIYDKSFDYRFAYPSGGIIDRSRGLDKISGTIGGASYEIIVDTWNSVWILGDIEEFESLLQVLIEEGEISEDTTLTQTTILGFPAYTFSSLPYSRAGLDMPAVAGIIFETKKYFLDTAVLVSGLSEEENLYLAEKLSEELTNSITPLWIVPE